ncbi:Interferon-induced helicase C domain-containing protein 1, partial [Dinochytrium kinnereticum]
MGRLDTAEKNLVERVEHILREGFCLPSQSSSLRYRFAGVSSSGRKEATAWFTASLDPQDIWRKLGNFRKSSDNKFKLLSRIGLSFGSSIPSITVNEHDMLPPSWLPDILSNGKNFTDGIGQISGAAAQLVSLGMAWKEVPSAIQVRVGGFKGVLATLDSVGHSHQIRFRGSMHKFESTHSQLEIMNYSRFLPLYLNRQIISILNSLGVKNTVFLEIQNEFLDSLLEGLTGRMSNAMFCINKSIGLNVCVLEDAGIKLSEEPFIWSLLQTHYLAELSGLIRKARIFVPKGALLIGIVDETRTLNYGECFVCVSSDIVPKSGPLLVYRNPATHPGDIRILQAVKEGLPSWFNTLKDVVVFPARGSRPHPDESGNGDLDENYMHTHGHSPMELDESEIPKVDTNLLPKDLPEAYARLITADSELGRLALAHLARSDCDNEGACSSSAIMLSKLHALQVDFPKTGISAPLDRELIPNEYPHFMEHPKKSYHSTKALGRLYDKAVSFVDLLASSQGSRVIGLSLRLNLEARFEQSAHYKDYRQKAENLYGIYKSKLLAILNAFSIENEAQLILSVVVGSRWNASPQTLENAKRIFDELQSEFRTAFEENLRVNESEDDKMQFIAAWYAVSYSDEAKSRALSFPWVMRECLLALMARLKDASQLPVEPSNKNQFALAIGRKAWEDFVSCRFSIISTFIARESQRSSLEVELRSGCDRLRLVLFGSSAIPGIADPVASDIDLCLVLCNGSNHLQAIRIEDEILFLELAANSLKELHNGTHDSVSLVADIKVPILRLKGKSIIDVDMVTRVNGIWKANYLSNYIMHSSVEFYITLYCLVKWARQSGLIGHEEAGGGRSGLFTTFGFCLLVIHHMLRCLMIRAIDNVEGISKTICVDFGWERFLLDAESADSAAIGRMILCFLKEGGQTIPLGTAFSLYDPFDSTRKSVMLNEEEVSEFHRKLYTTLHSTAFSGGDFRSAIGLQKQKVVKKVQIHTTENDRDIGYYYRDYIMTKAGIPLESNNVTLKLLEFSGFKFGKPSVTFEISGDGFAVEAIVKAIDEVKAEVLSAVSRKNTAFI